MNTDKIQQINKPVEILWDEHKNIHINDNVNITKEELKVAAYCRVSTDRDDQTDSFELQEQYYTKKIRNTPGWRLAGIYSDYGISGTQCKKRISFQRMMRHCEEGKIDRILCKSISRFARNTVDMLNTIRELKELKINVIFEKEGIDTLSVQSEFILSTIAAIAQEESRSISENMQWSFKKRFSRGIPVFFRLFGYDVYRENGEKIISINEAEAETVRKIYCMVLDGFCYADILRKLIIKKIPTVHGDYEWAFDAVKGILTNERYTGDTLCQKTYTADFLKHTKKSNKGEMQQYLIENHHDAIISKETFNKVQEMLKNNKPHSYIKNIYPLSSRFYCGKCGGTLHKYNIYSSYTKWRCQRNIKSVYMCSMEATYESFVETCMKKAFFEKYDLMRKNYFNHLIAKLKQMQDLDNVERDRVILKREIALAFKKEMIAPDEEKANAIAIRESFENKLKNKEELWSLLEDDRKYRTGAIKWLEGLPDGITRKQTFINELNIEYLRAWVISVKMLSPISFAFRWADDTETIIEMNEPEGDHRKKEWKTC